MQTFYVTFERQGNTEITIMVEAHDDDEAFDKAIRTFIRMNYDVYSGGIRPTEGLIIDEQGEEI